MSTATAVSKDVIQACLQACFECIKVAGECVRECARSGQRGDRALACQDCRFGGGRSG
jgi:hypothetical protein